MRSLKTFVISLCISVCLFGILAYNIVGNALLYKVSGDKPSDPSFDENMNGQNGTSDSSGDLDFLIPVNPDNNNSEMPEDEGITEATFLFIGTDYQPSVLDYKESGYNENGFYEKQILVSVDALLLVKIDKEKQTFMFSSIPTNAVLNKTTYKTVSDFYAEKGAEYMIECVYALTGIRAEHYAVIGVEDCVKALKQIGNITFNVPCDMKATDEWQKYEIDLKAGVQTLTPKQVVDMLRFKDYPENSKHSRETLLVDFSQALFSKLTAPSYFNNAVSLFTKVLDCFETKFTLSDFTDHLDLIFSYQKYTVKTVKFPGYTKELKEEIYFIPSGKEAIATYSEYK